jgi:hypothetical protein
MTDDPRELEPAPGLAAPPPPRDEHAPRALSVRAKRHGWTEPRARFWVVVAAFALAAAAVTLVSEHVGFRRETWLLANGIPVDAEITRVDTASPKGQGFYNNPVRNVALKYSVNGVVYEPSQYLTSFGDGYLEVGKNIRLHLDPTDPTRFTARQEPVPTLRRLLGGLLVLPLVPIALAVAALRRRQLLRTWEAGELKPAVVLRTAGVAVAPASRSIECAAIDRADQRVYRAYVPRTPGRAVNRGDVVWLVAPPADRGPTVAAAWFDRGERA